MTRAFLRPLRNTDLPELRSWRNHPDSRRWFFSQEEITEQQQERWFEELSGRDNERFFVIEDEEGVSVGTVSLYNIDPAKGRAEYGRMLIDPDHRGKGLALEATLAILRYAFSKLCLETVYLEVMTDNVPAVKLYQNIGFKTVRRYQKDTAGSGYEVAVMEISEPELLKTERSGT